MGRRLVIIIRRSARKHGISDHGIHAALAELIRYFSLRTPDSVTEQRRSLWQAHVALDDVADLSTFDRWLESGLAPHTAVSDDHTGCQHLAGWLVAEGYRGVLAPSAALPGSVNITAFGGRYEHVAVDDRGHCPPVTPTSGYGFHWRPPGRTLRQSW